MEAPNLSKIKKRLEDFSQNLKDNYQIGNSKIILAIADLVSVIGWASIQQERYSKKLIALTWAIVALTVLMFIGLLVQIYLA
ncbi:MAG: hypothetical protein COU30_02985 [Candidatus Magasanikbacteria bacterium CG10_big_fil_rev_8_21_14_0_10_38_6]|uniref:Uncharacterized protein n=1 Tax=Candidatus Magasanikbacteria bacterium CG10_big_fil_rev_8_21_14_0_10_38_6 TaxID=1974647 RepID=A0A2M6P1B4_9BACT|nr:MAG: hypothetical protein COU30_02985 [Candidatus Magasanikbacteria bacterium CG10_big_fil_rev_8_21_14_0_10_38_6]